MASLSHPLPSRRFLVLAFALLALLLAGAAVRSGSAEARKGHCAHCKGKAASKAKKAKAKAGKRGARPGASAAIAANTAVATPTASSTSHSTAPAAATSAPTPAIAPSQPIPTQPEEADGGPTETVSCEGGASTSSVSSGMGSFSAMSRPTSCWRPYAASSPFNTAIATDASTGSSSRGQIERLTGGGGISYFVAGDPYRDFGTAVYYPRPSDPTFEIHCTEPWGRCAVEGAVVHLPQGAAPSGPWPIGNGDADSHLTIVDQETGWEYDLWDVRSIGNGKIVTRWGGKTQIEGSGLGSDAVAAQFGGLAGIVRPAEMRTGQVNHALALTVPCTVGYVAPATKGGLECSDAHMSTANALPMGAHLQLNMGVAEIEAMKAPAWKKGILRAFATYGGYVEDTTGAESQWGIKFESANSSTSLGGPDEYVELAKQLRMEPQDYNNNGYPEYWFNVGSGVDWSRLRVVS